MTRKPYNLNRYTVSDGDPLGRQNTPTVMLTCSDCAGVVGRWAKHGAWPIAVEERKYQHAHEVHGEDGDPTESERP